MSRLAVASALLAAVTAAAPVLARPGGSAEGTAATFAGKNGKVIYVRGGDLYTMRADGRRQRMVRVFASPANPAWSPNGRMIAWEDHSNVVGSQIAVARANGRGSRTLTKTQGAGNSSPSWSPNGRKIAFARIDLGIAPRPANGSDIFVVPSRGGRAKPLTKGPERDYEPDWSPNGKKIAFVRSTSDQFSDSVSDNKMEIYVMNAKGRRVRRLTNNAVPDGNPSWSPNSKRILFARALRPGRADIFVMNARGRKVKRLTRRRVHETDPTWSPNGRQIVFSRGPFGKQDIYVMSRRGSGVKRLTRKRDNEHDPDWQALRR